MLGVSEVPAVSIRVLGPMELLVDGDAPDLPSRRQRTLLAALVVGHGRPVSVTDLVDAVWDDDPPDGARTTLQTYVSRVRRLVGQESILHSPAGYRLGDEVATDVADVRRLVAELTSLDRGDPRCADLAEQALARWTGPALAEFADTEWFRAAVVELNEMRANLIDIAAEGMIVSQRCPQAIALLEQGLASNPLREPSQILLVRALHGAGRTTDAVRAASRYRRALRETTGLVPGAGFAAVEQQVLAADEPVAAPTDPDEDGSDIARPDPAIDDAASPRRSAPEWNSATLPRPTPLIGRLDDLVAVREAMDTSRLVTVVGVGGVGKTRLVAEIVDETATTHTTLSIELSAVDADRVLATFGAALNLRDEHVELRHIADAIGARRVLIVIDNAEHVLDEVRTVANGVIAACPDVRFVVTSRERLALNAEVVVSLEPLGVDGPGADAVTLFVDRVRRARPHSEINAHDATIVDLCRRLDGIPLALELAASRAATLGVSALHERFDLMFGHLVDVDVDQFRHATLGNVVTWSIELLSPQSQELLAALSVFHGDFTLDAVEAIGTAIVAESVPLMFGRLVDTSLVTNGSRPGHFRLLEMIRHVAAQRLRSSERAGEVHRAHADWVAARLTEIDSGSVGPSEDRTTGRLDAIRPELLAALTWSLDSGNVGTAASIVTALAGPLLYRPDNELLGAIRGIGDHRAIVGSPIEPAVLAADARAAFLIGDLDDVTTLAERALDLADADDIPTRHRALHALGVVSLYRGNFGDSCSSFASIVNDAEAAIVERLDALGGLALARCYSGNLDGARSVAQQHRAISETMASDTYVAFADYALAEIDLAGGELDTAADRLVAAAERAWEAQARFVWGIASTVLARVLVRHRPPIDARTRLPGLIERWQHTATWPQLWTTLRLAAEHLAATDDPRTALVILDAANRDPSAPTLSDEDAEIHLALRAQIRAVLGEATTSGISSAAATIERVDVVERTLQALHEPLPT